MTKFYSLQPTAYCIYTNKSLLWLNTPTISWFPTINKAIISSAYQLSSYWLSHQHVCYQYLHTYFHWFLHKRLLQCELFLSLVYHVAASKESTLTHINCAQYFISVVSCKWMQLNIMHDKNQVCCEIINGWQKYIFEMYLAPYLVESYTLQPRLYNYIRIWLIFFITDVIEKGKEGSFLFLSLLQHRQFCQIIWRMEQFYSELI